MLRQSSWSLTDPISVHRCERMPQIMAEAFARGLVDKIMLEAFDVLDTNVHHAMVQSTGKLLMPNCQGETADIQPQSARTRLQIHDRTYVDCNSVETTDMIEKIVRGLRDVQIGDSSSVLPSSLSLLEKQVKHAACKIGSATMGDTNEATLTHITQGQGDVHQIMHDAIIEAPTDPSGLTTTRKEKENYGANEATRVTISLLHRMIGELETETNDPIAEYVDNPEVSSKKSISVWEENEERFIRSIESTEDADLNIVGASLENDSTNYACTLDYDRLKSSSPLNAPSLEKNVCLEEVAIEEITPSSTLPSKDGLPPPRSGIFSKEEMLERSSCGNGKPGGGRKKRGLVGRMRKFLLRAVFGWRKKD